jgi:hypothetical protein
MQEEYMNLQTKKDRYDGTFVFNEDTGEILVHVPNLKPKKRVVPIERYIGVDTKYPKDCITADSLLAATSVIDAYVKDKAVVSSHVLLECVVQGLLTPQEAKLLKYIITNCTAWNIYIGSTKDLTTSGIQEKNLTRLLTSMSPNILRIRERNKPQRGDIVIEFSPFYGWRGDNELRTGALNNWYGMADT